MEGELQASARDCFNAIVHAQETIVLLQHELQDAEYPTAIIALLDPIAKATARVRPLLAVLDAVTWAEGLRGSEPEPGSCDSIG